jgi:hypothetical protein
MNGGAGRPTRRVLKGKERATGRRPGTRRRTRRLLGWGLVALAGSVAGLGFYRWNLDRPGTYVPSLGNRHVQSALEVYERYNSDPPTSGPHLPSIAPWGIHGAPVARELQVHNLEDGGVAVQYHCPAGCPELVERLAAVARRYPDKVFLAPYPNLDRRIALIAWTRIDKFDEFDEARIVRFIEAYRGIDHHARGRLGG